MARGAGQRGNNRVTNLPARPIVFGVDPDNETLGALEDVASAMQCDWRGYPSGLAFCDDYARLPHANSRPACLVLETSLPGISGLEIQRRLTLAEDPLPIVFLTENRDIWLAVEVMRRGAVHYLLKPLLRLQMVSAIQEALALAESRYAASRRRQQLRERLGLLTPQDRQALRMIAEGMSNKEIAGGLGLSLRAAEMRRANLMKKLAFKSPLALVRFALRVRRDGVMEHDG